MREILFRGQTRRYGDWIEGYYCPCCFGYFPCTPAIIAKEEMEKGCWRPEEIIPDTVGQYTGLTDKNGKKIFEGDIVSTDIARPYLIVEYRDGCFMFNCNDGGEAYYDIMLPICKEAHTKYEYGEVIGNIHDHPELLKGAKDDA